MFDEEVMSATPEILSSFPHTHYIEDAHLVTWHPQGTLDDKLAQRIVAFLEFEEVIAEGPFNRYTDLTGITEVHLKVAHAFWIADCRRRGYKGIPVKSAFFADAIVTFGVARLYEELMRGAAIDVRVFRTRDEAAKWLQAPVDLLLPVP